MRIDFLKIGGALALLVLVGCGDEDDAQRVSQGAQGPKEPFVQVGSVKLQSTGHPQRVEQKDGEAIVTTDNNANATYQLTSEPVPVKGGDKINVAYKITVQPKGLVSMGLLNTKRNGWYGDELLLVPGTHEGIYEQVVPIGEKETSLVFRNYHLSEPGQSTFTIEDLTFKIN